MFKEFNVILVHFHIGEIEIRLQKRYITKKTHKRGLCSVGGISMFMMWIFVESLVIIRRFKSIRFTILQVIVLHDHNSTAALFCRDPYSCLPREKWNYFHPCIFRKKIFPAQETIPSLRLMSVFTMLWCII